MKFSDMMGKRDRDTTEVAEPDLPPEAHTAPPVPDAPIRFGGNRSELDEAAAAFGSITPPPTAAQVESAAVTAPVPVVEQPAVPAPVANPQPSIHEVVAELAPRPPSAAPVAAAAVTDQQLDTSAWLDGIPNIDDDLLPR